MKVIGLIGFSYDKSILEYYQEMLKKIDPIIDTSEYEILAYSIKRQENENNLISRLCDVYFFMMRNSAKILIFTDYKLEILSHYITMPGAPPIFSAFTAIANEIKKLGIEKSLVFDLTLSTEFGDFLNNLKKEQITFFVLNEQDRIKIKNILDNETNKEKLSLKTIEQLNKMLNKATSYGIKAILVDSPSLNTVLSQLNINLPVFYIRKAHAMQAIAYFDH